MSTVRAAQLIYTRLEPAYSPQMKSGFQTAYKSDSLSPADVGAIEKRIQCFQPNPPTLVRRQFFTLNSGAIVLTNTIHIDSHPEIVDITRRRGAFIAHCLILSRMEFRKVDYNPFMILDHYHFLDDAEDMVAAFGQATGVAPLVEIEVERPRYSPPSAWSGVKVRNLVLLAMRAEQLMREGRLVVLRGRDEGINEALRTVFFLAPRDKRLACTFDTHIDRCPTQQDLYWAVGTTTRQSGHSQIEVDATERRVVTPVEYTLEDKDLYLAWLNYASSQENFNSVMDQAFTVQLLAEAFAVRSQPRLDELDKEASREFMHLHGVRIMRDLELAVAKAVGREVAALLIHYLREAIEVPELLSIAASQHVDPAELSAIVTDWILEEKPDLRDGAWKALQTLARQGRNMRLLHLSATLAKKVDAKVRDEALAGMDTRTFGSALDQLMDPIAPADFVTPVHLPLLLSDSRLENMSEKQFIALVKAIIKVGAINELSSLAKHVKLLGNRPLVELEKTIDKHSSNVPPEFKIAVIARRQELGRPPTRLRFLRM